MTRNEWVTVFFLRPTVLGEVQGQKVDFPAAHWMEVFLVVTGPIGSVKTE